MGLIGILLLVTIISVGTLLGLWVLLANKYSRINQWFFAVSLFILLWNIFAFMGYSSADDHVSSTYFKLNFASVSVYFIAFYFFSVYFPVVSSKRAYIIDYTVVAIASIFAYLSLATNLVVASVSRPSINELILKTGPYGNVFYLFTLVLTFVILYNLFIKYRALKDINKTKTKYFIVGTLLYILGNIVFSISFALFFPTKYQFTQLGDFSAIFFLCFAGYAILKHHLFDIRVIATEATVIVMSLTLFIQTFVAESVAQKVVNGIIWAVASYGGYQLVKSVKKEIEQREKIQKLAKDLEVANKHLEELDEAKDNFISMASHELNTPIAAIEGYLSMILDEGLGGEIPEKAKKYLDSVYKSSKRLAALVRDLLNVSRIESNRIHIIYEEGQIEEIIDQAIMEVASKAREMNHEMTFERPETPLPKNWFDIQRTTEVLINLLGNAIKYTDRGGKIVVRVKHDGNNFTISVQDNGRGIPEEKKDKIFHKFVQLDVMKDEIKGTGLGMYISKNLVELQGGKIWFESEGEGKGSTFFFTLPTRSTKPHDVHEGEGPVLQLKGA